MMKKIIVKKNGKRSKNNGRQLTCPHCGAGADGNTVGLYWDFQEYCWKCVICGYREYEHASRSKSMKELEQELLLDQIMDSLD
ncbi:MAG: hypothetical protein IT392_12860 [Nitrospirae bacterium]|nr:hypothetical protein [Nitrospirota bacterium]